MTTWHYLPVYQPTRDPDESYYTLVEVHVDEAGRLSGWTEPQIFPSGDSVKDLAGALERMLSAVRRWKPVPYDSLKPGLKLELEPT